MIVIGTNDPDNLVGTPDPDDFYGRRGDDYQFGFGGDDIFNWNTGHGNTQPDRATVEDSDGADVIDGGEGMDRFRVFSDFHQMLVGSNATTHNLRGRLEAGPDGKVHFLALQGWDWAYHAPQSGTSQTRVTLQNVETFSYTGTKVQPEYQSGLVIVGAVDDIVVGDLTGTAMTGLLLFDLGADHDRLDASAAQNQVVALGGDGNDVLKGGLEDDQLFGGAHHDELHGGGGTNALIGGTGDDWYFSDNRNDTIIEQAGEGFDRIFTTETFYVSRANIDSLIYTGSANFTGIGTGGNEELIGSTGNDYLIGLGGDDYLAGVGGNNALQGGLGNDFYQVASAGDTLIEFADEGIDTVRTGLTQYALRDHFENLTYQSITPASFRGTGNALDNVITGGTAADNLFGLDGDDTLVGNTGAANTLTGGNGDDIYVVSVNGDQIVELAGGGIDLVRFAGTSFTLPDFVEDLIAIGSGSPLVRGNGHDNHLQGGAVRDNFLGNSGADRLEGNAGNDSLGGGDGDDILIGGAGGDELAGGAGADHYVFMVISDAKDMIKDFSWAENDKILVSDLFDSVGYGGSDPFADGYITFAGVPAFGSSGAPATRVIFDPDGTAGGQAGIDLLVVLGSMNAVQPSDFII